MFPERWSPKSAVTVAAPPASVTEELLERLAARREIGPVNRLARHVGSRRGFHFHLELGGQDVARSAGLVVALRHFNQSGVAAVTLRFTFPVVQLPVGGNVGSAGRNPSPAYQDVNWPVPGRPLKTG